MASLSLGGLTLPVGKSATDGSPLLNRKPLSRQAAGSNLGFKVDVSGGVKNQQAGGSSSSSSSDSGRKGSQGDMLSGEKVLRLVNTYLQQVAVDEDKDTAQHPRRGAASTVQPPRPSSASRNRPSSASLEVELPRVKLQHIPQEAVHSPLNKANHKSAIASRNWDLDFEAEEVYRYQGYNLLSDETEDQLRSYGLWSFGDLRHLRQFDGDNPEEIGNFDEVETARSQSPEDGHGGLLVHDLAAGATHLQRRPQSSGAAFFGSRPRVAQQGGSSSSTSKRPLTTPSGTSAGLPPFSPGSKRKVLYPLPSDAPKPKGVPAAYVDAGLKKREQDAWAKRGATLFADEICETIEELQEHRGKGGFYQRQDCAMCKRPIRAVKTKFSAQERCEVCLQGLAFTRNKPRLKSTRATHGPIMSRSELKAVTHESPPPPKELRKLNSRGLARMQGEVAREISYSIEQLFELADRHKYSNEYVPSIDLRDAIDKLVSHSVAKTWEKFGGVNNFQWQARFENLQERHEATAVAFLKEIDYYRSKIAANKQTWFPSPQKLEKANNRIEKLPDADRNRADCLDLIPPEKGTNPAIDKLEDQYPWFYEPLGVFSLEKQQVMRYLIDQAVYRILSLKTGTCSVEIQTDPPDKNLSELGRLDRAVQTVPDPEVQAMIHRLAQLEEQIANMHVLNGTLESSNEQLAGRNEELEIANQELAINVETLSTELEKVKAEAAGDLSAKIEEAVMEAEADLERRLTANFTGMLLNEQKKVSDLTGELNEAKAQIALQLEEIARRTVDYQTLEEQHENLRQELKKEQEAHSQLREQQREATANQAEKQLEVANLKSQLAGMKLKVLNAESAAAELNKQLEQAKGALRAVTEELEELKAAPPETDSAEALALKELMEFLDEEGRAARAELGIKEPEDDGIKIDEKELKRVQTSPPAFKSLEGAEEEEQEVVQQPEATTNSTTHKPKSKVELDREKEREKMKADLLNKTKKQMKNNQQMAEQIVAKEVEQELETRYESIVNTLHEQLEEHQEMMADMEEKVQQMQAEVETAKAETAKLVETIKAGKKPLNNVTVPDLGPVFERLWDDVRERWDRRKRLMEIAAVEVGEKMKVLYDFRRSGGVEGAGKQKLISARRAFAKYHTRLRNAGVGALPVVLSRDVIEQIESVKKSRPNSPIRLDHLERQDFYREQQEIDRQLHAKRLLERVEREQKELRERPGTAPAETGRRGRRRGILGEKEVQVTVPQLTRDGSMQLSLTDTQLTEILPEPAQEGPAAPTTLAFSDDTLTQLPNENGNPKAKLAHAEVYWASKRNNEYSEVIRIVSPPRRSRSPSPAPEEANETLKPSSGSRSPRAVLPMPPPGGFHEQPKVTTANFLRNPIAQPSTPLAVATTRPDRYAKAGPKWRTHDTMETAIGIQLDYKQIQQKQLTSERPASSSNDHHGPSRRKSKKEKKKSKRDRPGTAPGTSFSNKKDKKPATFQNSHSADSNGSSIILDHNGDVVNLVDQNASLVKNNSLITNGGSLETMSMQNNSLLMRTLENATNEGTVEVKEELKDSFLVDPSCTREDIAGTDGRAKIVLPSAIAREEEKIWRNWMLKDRMPSAGAGKKK